MNTAEFINQLGNDFSKEELKKIEALAQNILAKTVENTQKYIATTDNSGGHYALVATTRPETIMGDTALCINPNNPKTAWLKGKKVIVP